VDKNPRPVCGKNIDSGSGMWYCAFSFRNEKVVCRAATPFLGAHGGEGPRKKYLVLRRNKKAAQLIMLVHRLQESMANPLWAIFFTNFEMIFNMDFFF